MNIYNISSCFTEKEFGMHMAFWWESHKGRLHVGGWIILKWFFDKGHEVVWTGFNWLRIRT
jgi:hypothetical protein